MKKRPYWFMIVFSLVFILGNVACTLPATPIDPATTSQSLFGEPNAPETGGPDGTGEDNALGIPESKETENVRRDDRAFEQCEIDPTIGDFLYTKSEIGYNWVDATGGTWNDLSMNSYLPLDLPFNFPFYGETFSTIYVSIHGWMSFYNTEPTSPWVGMGSSSEDSWYAVAPYATPISWNSGNPGFYNLTLTSPNRFVVEYNNVYSQFMPDLPIGTYQAIFYENGTIDFNYDLVENEYGLPYSTGINHGAIYSNYVDHTFGSFPVDDVTLRFVPPERWVFITSAEMTASTDYTLTWVGHSNVTIDEYHVFVDYSYHASTTSEYMDLAVLSTGWNYIEVYMETGGHNYTVGMQLLVDIDTPIISIDYPPDSGNLYDAKVNWTAYDPTSYISYFDILIDGFYLKTVDGWTSETYVIIPNEMYHNITVVAYDVVGNFDWDFSIVWYNRTTAAAGFVVAHDEYTLWDVRDLYEGLGYLVDQISGTLSLSALNSYDAIFIGGGGMMWPEADLNVLTDFIDGGGKLVVS
ncbi:MAG: hypothetical protein EAX95_04900, partial [Candidatus Thorarchaeota archaeon]|nr:hypothetical protein [Candidatus Thorarchaeota archaeon]